MRWIPLSTIGRWPDKLKDRAPMEQLVTTWSRECRVNRTFRLRIIGIAMILLGFLGCDAGAQAVQQSVEPEFIQQAQTIHIPITVIQRETVQPVKDLTGSDFSLDIDGQPRPFQLSKPWSSTINSNTGPQHPSNQSTPNLLIILPLAVPVDRKDVLDRAIADLSKEPDLRWNISILDDEGNQTPYTRDLKTVIVDLKKIASENPVDMGLSDWRITAILAVASMRDLPGRRVVMTLGDIYHELVVDEGEVVYENFDVQDVATAARNAGAVIYAAESSQEIGQLRRLAPYYSLTGSGPWLLLTQDGQVAGWISNSVSDTLNKIRQDGMGAYNLDLHLDLKQMDGQLHVVSTTAHRPGVILDAPPYYIAPDLAQLRLLASVSPALRTALKNPPPVASSPLELATQLAYFPHPDGKTGTQIATTGFFWTATTPPPAQLETGFRLEQTSSGFVTNITIGNLQWSAAQPVWKSAMTVDPGAYRLRVAAANASGKIVAATDTPFTVDPSTNEAVMISSVVLGKTCMFAPAAPGPKTVDYLRAGNCDLQPDPTHNFSPQDVVWTLARITPVGQLANRPPKDWKASFVLINAKGSKLAQEQVRWLTSEDGSLIATTAFPLENPKLKLVDGEYAIAFRLKGPGVESDYEEDAPFLVYGTLSGSSEAKH